MVRLTCLNPNRYNNYIRGEWVESESKETVLRENPANRQTVTITPLSTETDMGSAIDAAREAFDVGPWRESSGEERSKMLMRFAQLLENDANEIAEVETRENGKVLKNSLGEIRTAAEFVQFFAGLARNIKGDTICSVTKAFSLVLKEPVGVCGIIIPWNSPVDLTMRKLAPALAAGCTVVIKPSSYVPGTILHLGKIVDKVGLPKGVVNIVSGPGDTVGETLVKSEKVDKISFTGDSATGKRIMSLAAVNLKRVSMELGGKSPNIVFEDANLDKAVRAAMWAIFRNCGQSCTAGSRLLLQESIHNEFIRKLVEMTSKIKIGDPMQKDVDIGPLVSAQQMNKVVEYVHRGLADGARLVQGGKVLGGDEYANGYYMEPTIFDDVETTTRLAQEEVFGPLLAVTSFRDRDDAITKANSTRYGLASAIWTNDIYTALYTAKKIRAGDVWVNGYHIRIVQAPFGGYKESGIGRELGERGLDEFIEYKHVAVDMNQDYGRVIR